MADKDADYRLEPGVDDGDDDTPRSVFPPRIPDRELVPGVPYGPPEPTASQSRMFDIEQREKRLDAEISASTGRSKKLMEDEAEELKPIRSDLEQRMSDPKPDAPEFKKMPPQPNLRQELSEQSQAFMGLATLIAAVGAGRTRNAGTTGLMAMAGIFNGIREGNEDRIKHDMDVWKQSVKVIKEENEDMVKEYKAKLEDRHMDLETKMEEMKIVAQKYKDQLMMEALTRRNLLEADKLIGAREKIAQQAENAANRAEATKIDVERKRMDLEQKKRQQAGEMTEARANFLAERVANGYKPTMTDLGGYRNREYNAGMLQDALMDLAKKRGWTAEQLQDRIFAIQAAQTGVRRTETQEANVGFPANELRNAIPEAKRAIAAYWQDAGNTGLGALRWNKAQVLFDEEQQTPELGQLAIALNAVMAPYSAILARAGVQTDATRSEAKRLLAESNSPQSAYARLDEMWIETERAEAAPGQTRQQILDRAHGRPVQTQTPQPGAPSTNRLGPPIPKVPPGVPPDSQYSPSRNQWRDRSGIIYDASGKPVQ